MTLAISTRRNFFPLHPKMQAYHQTHPMCRSKCHNVDAFSLEGVTYVDEWNCIGNW